MMKGSAIATMVNAVSFGIFLSPFGATIFLNRQATALISINCPRMNYSVVSELVSSPRTRPVAALTR